jgi:putative transcriptional regulator
MSQAELARKTNIRPNTISDLYNEMCDRVSLEQLDSICDALGCELPDLLVREHKIPRIQDKSNKDK